MHGKPDTTALKLPPSAVNGWAKIALILLFQFHCRTLLDRWCASMVLPWNYRLIGQQFRQESG